MTSPISSNTTKVLDAVLHQKLQWEDIGKNCISKKPLSKEDAEKYAAQLNKALHCNCTVTHEGDTYYLNVPREKIPKPVTYSSISDDLAKGMTAFLQTKDRASMRPVSTLMSKQVAGQSSIERRNFNEVINRIVDSLDPNVYAAHIPTIQNIINEPQFNIASKDPSDRMAYINKRVVEILNLNSEGAVAPIKDNKQIMQFIINHHKGNSRVWFAALSDSKLRNDPEVMLLAASHAGMILQFAPEEIRNNDDIVRAAISSRPDAFQYASERIRDNEAIARDAVLGHGMMLEHVSTRLKRNRAFVDSVINPNPPPQKPSAFDVRTFLEVRNNDPDLIALAAELGIRKRF